MALTTVDGGMLSATNAQYTGFKNRLINGAMVISQYYGSSSAPNGANYVIDRFKMYSNGTGTYTTQRVTDAPTGFGYSMKLTVGTPNASLAATDYYSINQLIEGLNVQDLNWGTSSAATVTLSFWVKASATGTYSCGIQSCEGSFNVYLSTFTINAANTWEQKSVTIPGATVGTWSKDNTANIFLFIGLGNGTTYSTATTNTWTTGNYFAVTGQTKFVGTAAATFQLTGVQLEKGSTATAFDYRPYGTELQLCQRYYQTIALVSGLYNLAGFAQSSTTAYSQEILYFVTPRAQPTVALPSAGQTSGTISFTTSTGNYPATTGAFSIAYAGTSGFITTSTAHSGLTAGGPAFIYSNGSNTIIVSAEL